MAQQKRPVVQPLSGKPPPPAGVPVGRAAPVRSGFIPPLMHRQKVEVARARAAPEPAPMVGDPGPVDGPAVAEVPPIAPVIADANVEAPPVAAASTQNIVVEKRVETLLAIGFPRAEAPRVEIPTRNEPAHAEFPEAAGPDSAVPLARAKVAPTRAVQNRSWRHPLLRYWGSTAIAMVFLLSAVAVAGIWLHSLGAVDRMIHADTDGRYYWVESWQGAVYSHIELDPSPIKRIESIWRVETGDPWRKQDPPPTISGAAWLGAMLVQMPTPGGLGKTPYFVMSHWLLVLILLLPTLWWLRNRRRLAALCRTRHCMGCGYDLRSTPERCPECGMPGPASDVITDALVRQLRQHDG